jgi:hypothetical protein
LELNRFSQRTSVKGSDMPLVRMSGRAQRVVLGVCISLMLAAPTHAQVGSPMLFGTDLPSIDRASALGLPLSLGSLWVGAWTQREGWSYADQQLRGAAARNVIPVVNWWYWGDDISPACVENGCQDARHNVWKDKAAWYRMSTELAQLIQRTMGGRPAAVVLETEFNKGGIETYEPFDGYLAEHAAIFQRHGVLVIVGFGNWGREHWPRFDRAIQSSALLGVQLMRSSQREPTTYTDAVDTLVASARYLSGTFGKAVVVTDLALSSYPSSSYEPLQDSVTGQLFARMGELKAAGVRGILYRMLVDDPTFDPSNYHGVAERFWGLLRADGSPKPAFATFVAGVRAESGGTSCVPAAPSGVTAAVAGSVVTLHWSAGAGGSAPTGFVLEAGSAPGLANLAVAEVPAPALQVAAPRGVYYVRIRARNSCGVSAASPEATVRVGL